MQLSHYRKGQRGFSLIEVLVALVVLSIGMLGIAALYVDSLRSGRTAIHRTQAVILVSDMAERIRANPLLAGSLVSTDGTGTMINADVEEGADKAISALDNTELGGRNLRVNEAKDKGDRGGGGGGRPGRGGVRGDQRPGGDGRARAAVRSHAGHDDGGAGAGAA